MKIDLLVVGKIKEKYFTDAINEYVKRLSRYVRLEIIEVKDEKTSEGVSIREEEIVMEREGERLERYLSDSAYLVALCIEGKQKTSVEFAESITELENRGVSHIQFIIGGSLGIAGYIKKRADLMLSFSEMTFPHQLMRVILLEQIYRAYRIKNNEPYHK